MLVSALGATLVGFALLVLALATGTLWLAVACIVICVAGAVLLLADTLGFRPSSPRRSRTVAGTADDGGVSVGADDDAPTEQFDRIPDDTVVTLGDDDPATADELTAGDASDPDPAVSWHGRHEQPDLGDDAAERTGDDVTPVEPSRRGRHGTPE